MSHVDQTSESNYEHTSVETAECQPDVVTDHNHKLYIETVGCQMNMLDSELVVADLRKRGYEFCSIPAVSGSMRNTRFTVL